MTVAAVMTFSSHEDALADTSGRKAVRRMVEAAWAGGATPIVVVCADPAGAVAQALAGSPAVLAEPVPDSTASQVRRGAAVALERVTETDAVLVWPGRMAWVDAETVTSLIELHGVEREPILRPSYDGRPGWPALVPVERLGALSGERPEPNADRLFETGDPGTIHDRHVALEQMPPYAGPPEPARQAPEWGASAADAPDDVPLEGPALAPYGQAAEPEAD